MKRRWNRLSPIATDRFERRLRPLLLASLLVMLSTACSATSSTATSEATSLATVESTRSAADAVTPASGATLVDARFVRIVDGDTIIVHLDGSDERVRLIGINSPELNKPDGPVECFATEASKQTEALIDGAEGRIQLERDVSETDQYGRLLRYVWLVSAQGKQLLNEELVEGGYARAITYRPDVKYQKALNLDQTNARNHGRGLWGACE